MRAKDLVVGEFYRHKETPSYGWAKVLEVLGPKQGVNTNTYTVVKVEWTTYKSELYGLIKYFKPSNLKRDK